MRIKVRTQRKATEWRETVIYEAHPAMFRAQPLRFILFVLLIAAFGIGLLILLYWYIRPAPSRSP